MRLVCLKAYAKGSQRYEPGQTYEINDYRGAMLLALKDVFMEVADKGVSNKSLDIPPKDKMLRRENVRRKAGKR